MTQITVTDLKNAKLDVDTIADIANSTAESVIDRLGETRRTLYSLANEFPNASYNAAAAAADRVQTGLDVIAANSARDAALIQAGVYTTEAEGRAAVADGQAFKVQGSGEVAAYEYRRTNSTTSVLIATYPSSAAVTANTTDVTTLKNFKLSLEASCLITDTPKNLYNPSAKQAGKYVKTNGVIDVASGWACTDYIPVVAGQQYTISANATKREGVAFFTSNSTLTGISGSYISGGTLPLTVTAPVGANYMVVNVQSSSIAEPSQIQIESGSSATAFEAWRLPAPKVPRDGLTAAVKAELGTLAGDVASANATKEYETIVTSKNLFNTATVRAGYYLNSAKGAVNGAAGWGMSAFIPVTAGQQYTISGNRGRDGVSFFTAASDGSLLAGSYISTSGLPLTVTAPLTATHMVINLYSTSNSSYSEIQVELGSTATDYTPIFGSHKWVQKSKITPEIREVFDGAKLVLDNTLATSSYIQARLSGSTSDILKIIIMPFLTRNLSTSEVFNFSEEKLNEVRFKSSSDDVAPYRVYSSTIGANHGYSKTKCTVTGHTKTTADIGSVWSDGVTEWVIVDVATNFIWITGRTTGYTTSSTLTHVSCATNTTSFTPSATVVEQWYPVIKNRQLTCSVDNQQLATLNGTFYYTRNVTFNENYEIMNKSSIVEWLITRVGTSPTPSQYDGTSDLSVSMSFVFDTDGNCTIYQDFLALNNIANFQDIMFLQAIKFTAGVSGAVRYYIPKALSFVHESVTYDFSTLRDMTSFSVSTRINMTSSRCEATGQLCDRLLMMNDSVVGAFGFLPIQSADPSVRRTNASNKAMQISEAAKLYMSCIDGLKTSLTAGDYFSAVAYRNFFKRTSARTSCYAVRHPSGTYLYMDWHSATTDRVPVPTDMVGKSFTVVEKSANVSILSGAALTNTLVVQVTSAASYGYLIIKTS